METSAEKPADSPRFRNGRRRHRATKLAPLTRNALDGRSNAIKQFDAIASSIVADLGGEDQLTTVQRHLIEAFAGASITVDNLNARLLLGEKLDILEYSTAISTMVRVASRIGLHRVATDITPPPVGDYADHINVGAREAAE
jgi:hypothetical protein